MEIEKWEQHISITIGWWWWLCDGEQNIWRRLLSHNLYQKKRERSQVTSFQCIPFHSSLCHLFIEEVKKNSTVSLSPWEMDSIVSNENSLFSMLRPAAAASSRSWRRRKRRRRKKRSLRFFSMTLDADACACVCERKKQQIYLLFTRFPQAISMPWEWLSLTRAPLLVFFLLFTYTHI